MQRRTLRSRLAAHALVAVVAGVAVGAGATSAWTWQRDLAGQQRLLPGVTVAGHDVGNLTLQEARVVARRAADEALDRAITVAHGDRAWRVTGRDLGAGTTVEDRIETAAAATSSTSLAQLAMIRWLRVPGRAIDVGMTVPAEAMAAFLDEVADTLDREPRDASAELTRRGLRARGPEAGQRVDRVAAATALLDALHGSADRVELPIIEVASSLLVDDVERVAPAVAAAVEDARDRPITIVHGDRRWRVTPRSLDAVPDLGPVVAHAVAHHDQALRSGRPIAAATASDVAALAVPFEVPDQALGTLLDTLAAQVAQGARDATVDHSTGWVRIVPGLPGRTVDRHRAAVALRAALAGGADSVELPIRETRPSAMDLPQVLLVRQNERRLYLYEGGEIVREWPVAVGQAGAATPTGVFTVGALRTNPVWYNPAPNGWGAGMPRVVGPGPGNPLGLRAINWNDGEHDTLIRFHGTANAGSIGRAASRGCVRLTNAHVVELFEMVEPGATIVSIRE